jgi:hypothetical protein
MADLVLTLLIGRAEERLVPRPDQAVALIPERNRVRHQPKRREPRRRGSTRANQEAEEA